MHFTFDWDMRAFFGLGDLFEQTLTFGLWIIWEKPTLVNSDNSLHSLWVGYHLFQQISTNTLITHAAVAL
jgi:hypothetical protein